MTVNCKFISENIIEIVYDEIKDENLLNEIKMHIKSCAECRNKINSYLKIKEKMQDIVVDFPPYVWEIYTKEVKEKLNKKTNFFENIFKQIFSVRKIIIAFALIFLLVSGIQIFKIKNEKESSKKIIENMEILENISILEHLDFYEKLSEGNVDL
mgnify:CR=1 FL=1|jgi:hypothetical protein